MGSPARTRKALILAATALVFAALLALLIFQARKQGFSWTRVRGVVGGLNIPWLVAGSLIALLTYPGRALRWRVLLRPLRPQARFAGLLSSTLIGFAAVSLLGRPAELIRPYLIAVKEGVSFPSQLGAWFIERVYDLLVALLIFGFALSQVGRESGTMAPGPALSWVLRVGGWTTLASVFACSLTLLMLRLLSQTSKNIVVHRLRFLSPRVLRRIDSLLQTLLQGVASTRSTAAVLEIVFWSFAEWILIAASYRCIVQSFGGLIHFNWIDVVIFMGFVSFGSIVQIPGIGGGMQVAAVVVLTEIFGLPLETATTLAMLIWLITSALVIPVGFAAALGEGITWANLREARRNAINPSAAKPNAINIQEAAYDVSLLQSHGGQGDRLSGEQGG